MSTARTSLIPVARGRLYEVLSTGLAIKTFYGWDANIGYRDAVIVGGLAAEDATQTFQTFGGPNGPAREEEFRLVVMVRCTRKGQDNREAYERAYALVAEVELILRTNTTLELEDYGVQLCAIDRFREAETPDAEGWHVGIDVYVRIQAVI